MSVTPLEIALLAAVEAGDYFKSRVFGEKVVKTKSSPADLVTDVDPMCEKLIRERIATAFQEHAVLGEESTEPGAHASIAATKSVESESDLWIVDPLDGTTNFVVGIPLSTVSIAYAREGAVQVGVVYDPYREEVFYAERGRGAWLASREQVLSPLGQNLPGRQLAVSTTTQLERSVMASGFPTRSPARELTTEAGIRLSGKLKSFRALGSAAMHMAYVAAGRIDGFWEYDLNAWDLAAGSLLVTEAGGVVEGLQGGSYSIAVRDILATSTEELRDITRKLVVVEPREVGNS